MSIAAPRGRGGNPTSEVADEFGPTDPASHRLDVWMATGASEYCTSSASVLQTP